MSIFAPFITQLTGPGGRFEIATEDIGGVTQRTYKDRPDHLRVLIERGLSHGDREFLVQGDVRYSYSEAMTRSLKLARVMHDSFGIGSGDRIAVLGSNAPDWVVSFWAAIAIDAVVVPLNAWWRASELTFVLEDSASSLVLCDARRAETAIEAGAAPDRVIVWGEGDIPDAAHHLDALVDVDPLGLTDVEARGEDSMVGIFYTSGTTGRPKGSANTHRNVLCNLLNAAAFLGATRDAAKAANPDAPRAERTQDIDLMVIPMFHTTGLMSTMIPYVYAGHKIVYMPPGRFDPFVAAEIIESERITRFGGVPTIVARIIDSDSYVDKDFSSVTAISYGGAPASAALLAKIGSVFPNLKGKVIQGYGLTETSPLLTLNVGPDYEAHPDSVGVAVPTVELKIAGPEGEAMAMGETGEIWAKGANIIAGYFNRPEVNATTFVDGYFRTGDVGHLTEEGFLYITDRAKDVVIRGGENIYCVEVESVIDHHPDVLEAAVIGVPHEDLGEELKAIVVVGEGAQVTEAELRELVGESLASFKVPAHWEIRTELLPRNPSGKVLKPALRDGHSAVFGVGEETDSAL